jgi:phosphoribosylglycinamide formyltransferase 2
MTTLGTPYAPSATRVLVLGAGELGKELVIALQRLGVETTAVDHYPRAPAHQVAHHARTIDMTDARALLDLLRDERPDVVVPELEAIATAALEELESEGAVRVVPTARATRLTMDREGIRRLAAEELGLRTSAYVFCGSREEVTAAATRIGLPCLVKPVMSSSGKGQSRLDVLGDVERAWDHAVSGGRVSAERVIVEELVEFDVEITLLTVRSLGPDGAPATSFCAPIGHVQVAGDYVESWQPQALSRAATHGAEEVARLVTDALGGLGVFGVELFVRGDDVWFSEVSPRPHDTGMVTMASQWQSEFDLHARAILGLPVDTSLRVPAASAVIYGATTSPNVVFDGVDQALAVPGTDLRLFGKPESRPRRRLGVALARADDVDTARERAVLAAALVVPREG